MDNNNNYINFEIYYQINFISFYFMKFHFFLNEKNYLFILFWIAVQWIDNDQGI